MHQRFGKLPFADLMQPAIEVAQRGYLVPVVVQPAAASTASPAPVISVIRRCLFMLSLLGVVVIADAFAPVQRRNMADHASPENGARRCPSVGFSCVLRVSVVSGFVYVLSFSGVCSVLSLS